nr:hypothetical protein [Tanacetum cinerariifolium]
MINETDDTGDLEVSKDVLEELEYSRLIGYLIYARTYTRLKIVFDVGKLSRQHWKAIIRIFKYLRGTKDYGLSYVGYPSVLEGYSDASWINHVEDSSSTSGALAAAGKEIEWLRNLIHEILIWSKPIAPISIRCDSAPTMARAYSEIYNGKSRHLGNSVRQNDVHSEDPFGINEEDGVCVGQHVHERVEVSNDTHESTCSGHFKKSEVPRKGGSILELIDDLVNVGQTMGYDMKGCIKNMEEIIESQGVDKIHR